MVTYIVEETGLMTIVLLLQLDLEWATLSKYTGNDTYRQLTERAARHIANLVSGIGAYPLSCFVDTLFVGISFARFEKHLWVLLEFIDPSILLGLAAQGINPANGNFVGGYVVGLIVLYYSDPSLQRAAQRCRL